MRTFREQNAGFSGCCVSLLPGPGDWSPFSGPVAICCRHVRVREYFKETHQCAYPG